MAGCGRETKNKLRKEKCGCVAMHTDICKHVKVTMTANITTCMTAITITVTSKTLKETSYVLRLQTI